MKTIIAIGGEPAVGKSTIIKKFMEGSSWWKEEPEKLVVTMKHDHHNIRIVGDYSDKDHKFPGTDRLSMAVQPQALKFFENTNAHILFEGDRLFNRSLLEVVADWADSSKVNFHIIIVEADKHVKHARHSDRKDDQEKQFLDAKETKIENISSSLVLMDYLIRVQNNTQEDLDTIVSDLWAKFN